MKKRKLGQTGLEVSLVGLGCGGHSRIGIAKGTKYAAEIVKTAIENGITFIDTAEVYKTEAAIGLGIREVKRDEIFISSKFSYYVNGAFRSEQEVEQALDRSLKALGTDYLDVYHIHGVEPSQYHEVVKRYVPVMRSFQEKGKIRYLGITEGFNSDPAHEMLGRAVKDRIFDVCMIGYNLLNFSAEKTVLPALQQTETGVLCMFAVRNAISKSSRLEETLRELVEKGVVTESDVQDRLAWLVKDGYAQTLPEAAYRFCAQNDGLHVVLSGTSQKEHLLQNIQYINSDPLPEEATARIYEIFKNVDCITGE